MKGQVKWFSLKKGYGFITGEDGKDYFFHYTMMPQGVLLKEEDSINFEVLETEKGLQAKDITLSDTPVVIESKSKDFTSKDSKAKDSKAKDSKETETEVIRESTDEESKLVVEKTEELETKSLEPENKTG